MSEQMRKLTPEELEKVGGGVMKTIVTDRALVRMGPGCEYSSIRALRHGITVNFTGNICSNDIDHINWLQIDFPVSGWLRQNDLGN